MGGRLKLTPWLLMLNVPRQRKSTAEHSQDGNHWKASKGVAKGVVHVVCVTVIVEASAPRRRAPSRRPHPCHPCVMLRSSPTPRRERRPAATASLPPPAPRLGLAAGARRFARRGQTTGTGHGSRHGARPRARSIPHPIRPGPGVIGAHGRDTVETRVRGRDADIGPYATAVPLVPNHEQDHESTRANEDLRSRDGRLPLSPLTDSFSCCETRKSQEVDGKDLPLNGCCPAGFTFSEFFH